MTRRWGSAYQNRFEALVWRQKAKGQSGNLCEICGREKDDMGRSNLIVEHIDNDKDNFSMDNTRLAHPSCNQHKNPRGPQNALPQSVSVKTNPAPKIRSQDGFAPNKNREAEPLFRRWVYAIVKANKDEPKAADWLIRNGSAFIGANPVTVDRYLDKMLSEIFGMLIPVAEDKKGEVLVFKYLSDYDLTVEELEMKYPWTGAVTSELFNPIRKPAPLPENEKK